MSAPTAWEIIKLVFVCAMLGSRLQSWADGDPNSPFFAVGWALWAVSIAYNMWAKGRVTA